MDISYYYGLLNQLWYIGIYWYIISLYINMGVSYNGGTPIIGWFSSWNTPFKTDDLGVPPFQETSI